MSDQISALTDKTIVETLILSSAVPLSDDDIAERLGYRPDLRRIVESLNTDYEGRGIQIVEALPNRFAARSVAEASDLCRAFLARPPRLSRAGYETLSIIAHYQPVTRGEINRIRGVALSPGTLEIMIYMGFVRLGPRRSTPGNPMTFMTTDKFLETFNIRSLDDLPERPTMVAEGLLDAGKGISTEAMPQSDSW